MWDVGSGMRDAIEFSSVVLVNEVNERPSFIYGKILWIVSGLPGA